MPLIRINEEDLTKPGTFAESFEVVYIPGLVNTSRTDNPELYDGATYIGIAAHKPQLFTSVSQFEAVCGKVPAKFSKAQRYTDLNVKAYIGTWKDQACDADGNLLFEENGDPVLESTETAHYFIRKGFAGKACPLDRIMFTEGAEDPSYLMAKDLLSKGLNVLYERVNPDLATERCNAPDEASNGTWPYANYAFKKTCYKHIMDTEPPVWKDLEQVWATDPYCAAIDDSQPTINVFVDGDWEILYPCVVGEGTEPADWAEFYSNYVIKLPSEEFEPVVEDDLKVPTGGRITTGNKAHDNWVIEPTEFDGTDIKKMDIYNTYYSGTTSVDTYLSINADGALVGITAPLKAIEVTKLSEKEYEFVTHNSAGDEVATYVVKIVNDDPAGQLYNATIRIKNSKPTIYVDFEPTLDTTTMGLTEFLTAHNVSFEDGTIVKVIDPYSVRSIYAELETCFDAAEDRLVDKGNYSIKYLTSGGYPTFEYNGGTLAKAMMDLAAARGDCVALIDHADSVDRPVSLSHPDSLYQAVQAAQYDCSYAAMFTPWCTYAIGSAPTRLPASYAYLTSLAKSISNNNPSWLAIAGSARGKVSGFADGGITTPIPNSVADGMQPRSGLSVNAITNIKPYGEILWGNRTLKRNGDNLTATSFLNTRNMVSDIKKVAYRTARQLTFEQNSDVLWVNFMGSISPTLDRMVSGSGISGYKILRDTTHEKASEKAALCAKIVVYPVYAVEDFYITVSLKDDEVTVK